MLGRFRRRIIELRQNAILHLGDAEIAGLQEQCAKYLANKAGL